MNMIKRGCVLAAVLVVFTGCKGGMKSSTDVHVENMDRSREGRNKHFDAMRSNAALREMSIADFHFVANSMELNGTGVAKLDQMAPLLETYGGTVHLDTAVEDEKLVKARIERVREYLSLAGCSMEKVDVKPGLPGGDGVPVTHALTVEHREMYGKGAQGQSSAAPAAGMTPPSSN